jgi:hypothetical protein
MSTGSLPRDSSDGQSKKSKRNKKKIANSDFLKNIFAQRSDLPKGWSNSMGDISFVHTKIVRMNKINEDHLNLKVSRSITRRGSPCLLRV